jgi:hypothetical protein
MPLAGFEPTISVFKRAKTFHGLYRVATVTGGVEEMPPPAYKIPSRGGIPITSDVV